jgi:predicted metal-dependent hydrolase
MITAMKIDDLDFEVRRSNRRRSVQITVDRGGELVLIAPDDCPQDQIEGFVRARRMWIFTKLAEKDALRHPPSGKQFVNGEGFPYLGRSYRLLVVDDQDTSVKLTGGRFRLHRQDVANGREQIIAWYTTHGLAWLSTRLTRFSARLGVIVERLQVKDLGYRWASCGRGGALYFHWRTILLPPRIVDYILVHELAHIHEPHHTPEFWARIERVLPDYVARKQWLATHGQAETGW